MNVLEAKTNFSKIISLLETKKEQEVIVAREGVPVVRISYIEPVDVSKRIRIAKGKFVFPDNTELNSEIENIILV